MPADPAVSVYIGTCELRVTARVPDSTTTSGSEIASFGQRTLFKHDRRRIERFHSGDPIRLEERDNNYLTFCQAKNRYKSYINVSILLTIKNMFIL